MLTASRLYSGGFTDIISVVPPGAKLAPGSKLRPGDRGKVPGRRRFNDTWVGFGGWQKHETTQADAEQWVRDGANVGLRTQRFPAIDIDCDNEDLSHRVAAVARRSLGPAPSRIGRAPKQLLLYRTKQPFRRLRLWFKNPREERQHLVEVLGAGQQFVTAGIHPMTNRPYEWDQDITQLGPDGLTTITREGVERFLNELKTELRQAEFTCTREGHGGFQNDRAKIDQEELKAPSIDELRRAVECIPNTNDQFPGRDDYIRMGYAIRAAAQDDPETGFDLFAEWALRWEGNGRYDANDPETVRADWERMAPPYEIGWDYVAALARGHGYDHVGLCFDAEPGDPNDSAPEPIEYSEQHLADIFIDRHGSLVRYMQLQGSWYAWDGVKWSPDARRLTHEFAKQTLREVANRVARFGAADIEKEKALKFARSLSTKAKVNNVLELASSDRRIAITPEQLDAHPWLLNTPGGVLDLRTGELKPGDPTQLHTKVTSAAPEAGRPATLWHRFLEEATGGDQQLQAYLQRLAGYSLTGAVSEHVLAFVHGGGGNGKSVFLTTLAHVLGDYATQAAMSTFLASTFERHPTELAALRGARLVAASETDSRGRWNEARLKALSGGDPITARFMHRDFFTYQPQFKLVLVGNHKPALETVDDAIRRRLHLVPFTQKPERPDPDLPEKLRAEAGPILHWMIEGCLAWQRLGLAPPPSVVAATTEYFEDEDAVGRWLAERCKVAPSLHATTAELFNDWREWCGQRAEDPGSYKRLSELLRSRGFQKWREPRTRRMGFRGVALLPSEPDLPDLNDADAPVPSEVGQV